VEVKDTMFAVVSWGLECKHAPRKYERGLRGIKKNPAALFKHF
jgi:hypothetical protein